MDTNVLYFVIHADEVASMNIWNDTNTLDCTQMIANLLALLTRIYHDM